MSKNTNALSLGIDIGGTNTELGLVDENGVIVAKTAIKTAAFKGAENLVERIWKQSLQLADGGKITRIGAGIAGLIEHKEGIVRFSPNLEGWKNVALKDMFSERFSVPVALGNDVNVIAWGEYSFGGYETENLFCFTLGTGVGGGIIAGGRLILGANDAAAEFGHTAFEGETECLCGLTGCLETYVSANALINMAARRSPLTSSLTKLACSGKLTTQRLAKAAHEGNRTAQGIFREAGQRIGKALGNVVQLLDPEVIVINGGISKAGEILIEPIKDSLKRYIMPLPERRLRVVQSSLGEKAGILGASALLEIFN